MQDKEYRIRTMNRKEVDFAIELAAREGWNPGIHDADCYYSADPNGFLVGMIGDEAVATISAIKSGRSFGFIGFYIVKPEYRGKGYGIQIWNAGLHYLEGRNIGLDSVVAQEDNYRKSGFERAYRTMRYEGMGGGTHLENSEVVRLSSLPFGLVDSYDRPFFPANRSRFIKSWINQPRGSALGIMHDGSLVGYGVIRACRSGHKIGPLFADGPELAESLLLALKSGVESTESVYLDVPEVNRAALALAERNNMRIVVETVRMYTGEKPDMPLERLFGVTSLDLG